MEFFKKIKFDKAFAVHVTCWTLFIAYEFAVLFYSHFKLEPLYVYLIYYGINICYFYLFYFLLDFITYRSKPIYWTGSLLLVLLFSITLLIKSIADYFIAKPGHSFDGQIQYIRIFIPGNIYRNIYFTLFAFFYWAAGYITYQRKQTAKAERDQLIMMKEKAELSVRLSESRNAYLRQQLNPHMLFNALNFVYNRMEECSAEAADCLVRLTDIMRFSMEDADSDGKVSLSQEIGQLRNLILINQYRFNDGLNLKLTIQDDVQQVRIIPLILLTLTENLFKHGNLIGPSFPAELEIRLNEGRQLFFETRNFKKQLGIQSNREKIGLQNVIKRLDFTYPGQYELSISETDLQFKLNLNIWL